MLNTLLHRFMRHANALRRAFAPRAISKETKLVLQGIAWGLILIPTFILLTLIFAP